MLNQTVEQVKEEEVRLDFLPFIYNLVILLNFAFNYFLFDATILGFIFGFSLFTSYDLYKRSKNNNYYIWHRVPILNMFMIDVFVISDYLSGKFFHKNLLADLEYPLLYYMYGIWLTLFIVSAIFFLKHKLKKTCKRCTLPHC